jgi:hypothetical protein
MSESLGYHGIHAYRQLRFLLRFSEQRSQFNFLKLVCNWQHFRIMQRFIRLPCILSSSRGEVEFEKYFHEGNIYVEGKLILSTNNKISTYVLYN